ncbi:MAG: DUF4442 domain-containing protein [Bacteroidetes bacterium]|nr:DUF4442 domain-containing protein [Bacteroidota bacterium]
MGPQLNKKQNTFRSKLTNKWMFKLYLFQKMPIALLAGLQIRELNLEKSVVSVPFKWFSQNPFKSVYFATQAMAAEMSTGILGLMAIQGAPKKVSMLVLKIEGNFIKKATERIYFTCENGNEIFRAVDEAVKSGEGITVNANSTGKLKDGTIVSQFSVIWSFKSKQ